MFYRFSTSLVLGTLAGFGLASLDPSIARAAIITYDFQVEIETGPLISNIFNGFLSYDDSSITGSGTESLVSLNSFSFTFDGNSYDLSNNPVVNFFNGSFLGLDFSIPPSPAITFLSGTNDTSDADFLYDTGNVPGAGTGLIEYTLRPVTPSTPEPTLGFGLLLFGTTVIALRRPR